jgi:hypothetical protein
VYGSINDPVYTQSVGVVIVAAVVVDVVVPSPPPYLYCRNFDAEGIDAEAMTSITPTTISGT